MKTILLTLALTILGTFTWAQKCTYNFQETNAKTGLHKKRIMIPVTNQFVVWTNNEEGVYKIGIEVTFAELQKENIKKGDTLTVLFSDNEEIYGIADEKYTPIGKADEMIEATTYYPFYTIKASDWAKFCATPVQVMKITFGKEYTNYQFNESKAKKIKQAANCVK